MQATADQIKIIQTIMPTRDIKEEWVQWATEDVTKISCKDLTFDQANKILVQNKCAAHKPLFYAKFDKKNKRHKYLLSVCITYGWFVLSGKFGRIADLDKLNEWMLSALCPVRKPLMKMTGDELSKVIAALENMSLKQNSKPLKV